jgi:hypothetical protein
MIRQMLALVIAAAVLIGPTPAFANGRRDHIPTMDLVMRQQVQIALRREGFFRGPINGRIGPQTKDAIRRFRIARGIAGEQIVYGPGEVQDLTYYLTPALIRELFHVEIGTGTDELSMCQQAVLMTRLGITPGREYEDFVSPEQLESGACPTGDDGTESDPTVSNPPSAGLA